MFSYFGSKSKIIKEYPKPIYNLIIEPFAGSARYALLHNADNVILNDSYEIITKIWDYLINATEEQILNLPEMNLGDSLKDIDSLSQVEKYLMGFMVNLGVPGPCNIYSKFAYRGNEIRRAKKRIIGYLNKIRNWVVVNKSYEQIGNIKATWFIDPPYQFAGGKYKHYKIDYNHLANWCKSRKGQVIVCENCEAEWLNFKPLCGLYGQKGLTIESMYYQETA